MPLGRSEPSIKFTSRTPLDGGKEAFNRLPFPSCLRLLATNVRYPTDRNLGVTASRLFDASNGSTSFFKFISLGHQGIPAHPGEKREMVRQVSNGATECEMPRAERHGDLPAALRDSPPANRTIHISYFSRESMSHIRAYTSPVQPSGIEVGRQKVNGCIRV